MLKALWRAKGEWNKALLEDVRVTSIEIPPNK